MTPSNSLLITFLTGLTTGGLTCLAIQGSLIASVTTQQSTKSAIPGLTRNPSPFLPIFSFLTAKLITHTILGFLLGLLGTTIKLTPIFQGYFQVILGIYLFGVAGNLLNIHPFFRYFILTPPKLILRFARNISKTDSSQVLTAAALGALTIFLPCATTQAVEVIALTTASPFYSASILFFFILGTIPTFLLFGFALTKGQNIFQNNFSKILGLGLILMSIYTINTGTALTGSVYTIQNFSAVLLSRVIPAKVEDAEYSRQGIHQINSNSVLGANIQIATINVSNQGYSPKNITLKKNVPTSLKLITNNVANCSRSFTIPSLNINKLLPETGESTIEFTPTKEGLLAFSCSMGMYTGNFNVIN